MNQKNRELSRNMIVTRTDLFRAFVCEAQSNLLPPSGISMKDWVSECTRAKSNNNKKMAALYECCVIKYNLFIIITPAARFKTSKSSCLPHIGRYAVPQHRATMAETVFQKLRGRRGLNS